ncbi:MAG TPA: hypothetical protein V6D05_00290 [Stenomitos sp.]
MVTHGGRCPNCQNRTTPGIGKRAGQWICFPCKLVLDNYGQIVGGGSSETSAEPAALAAEPPRRAFMVLPRPGQIRRNV